MNRSLFEKIWEGCVFIFILSLIIYVGFYRSDACAADIYMVAGAGVGRHELNGNGVWYQDGFDHKVSSDSTTYHAGLGWQALPWLAVEGLYHDFGKTKIDADFVLQDENYNPKSENHCNGRCNPLVHGQGTGRASGFSLSLVPSYGINRDWSVYARLGVLWYKRTWEERLKCCAAGTHHDDDAYGPELDKTFNTVQSIGNGEYLWTGDSAQVSPRSTGLATIWGLGLNYKSVRFEAMGTKGVQAMGSGHTNIGTVSISYRLGF